MKRGREFHIKPEKEEFTLTKIRESFDGEVTQSFQEGQNFDRQIREEEVGGENVRGRREGMSKAKLV